MQKILIIVGPTASGKSARGVEEALSRGGEIISVDSRQVYRGLDVGTEKISSEEMRGVPHHLINVLEPEVPYSAGEFAEDAAILINEITRHGKLPILVGGTHFYFDALLHDLPKIPTNPTLRKDLEELTDDELLKRIGKKDLRRARELDPKNRRRLIRALEIIDAKGSVPARAEQVQKYDVEWIVLDPPKEELRDRINRRLEKALADGLIDEVARVRARVGDERLNELGLEYRIVGEYLRGERADSSLLPILTGKLNQYARRQRAWLRKLQTENATTAAQWHPGNS